MINLYFTPVYKSLCVKGGPDQNSNAGMLIMSQQA